MTGPTTQNEVNYLDGELMGVLKAVQPIHRVILTLFAGCEETHDGRRVDVSGCGVTRSHLVDL